jgi:ribosomal protein S18 acetylase RimI-like enzyme
MTSVQIKTATASHIDQVVNAIALAFSADPIAHWFFPEPQQYLKYFPGFVKAFAGAAFEHGSGDCVEDFSGAALWLPPGVHPDEKALFTLLQEAIPKRDQGEVFGLLERMDRNHPAEPHWYLPMIGVEPAKQGNGHGTALLMRGLERCDDEDQLAYLESSSPKNIPLYERHGFESAGVIQVGSSPPLFPMLRRPRRFEQLRKRSLCRRID